MKTIKKTKKLQTQLIKDINFKNIIFKTQNMLATIVQKILNIWLK